MESKLFKSKKPANNKKLRGGYYTPKLITEYVAKWILNKSPNTLLEPSFGDGNFIESIINKLGNKNLEITGVEINQEEFYKGINRIRGQYDINLTLNWINNDFFKAYDLLKHKKFDAIVGNPPFIRFQYFNTQSQENAFKHLRDNNYKPTKLANVWSAFVQLSISLLHNGGHLAMVLPAELLQVKYAKELRDRIISTFDKSTLISFKKLVFPDILQEVVILLCEGKRDIAQLFPQIKLIELNDGSDLVTLNPEKYDFQPVADPIKNGIKWTSLYVSSSSLSLIDEIYHNPKIPKFRDFADVNVGIVTGRNKFFVINEETLKEYELSQFVLPLVGKTSAINKINFNENDFDSFKQKYPAYLLNLKGVPESKFTNGLKKYISLGEKEGVNLGYKCRIRKRWYDVPSVYISDGFMYRQIYKYPLLVENRVKASCTDTIHRVRLTNGRSMKELSTSFINSLTFAWSELCGRSYGGGVLELEPNEAKFLPIPISKTHKLDEDFINNSIKSGNINKALDYVDEELLIKEYGLSKTNVDTLRNIWITLSSRRINRN